MKPTGPWETYASRQRKIQKLRMPVYVTGVLYYIGVEIQVNDDWQYEHYSVSEPSAALPLSYFHAQPCVGKRTVGFNLQIDSDTTLSVVITGNTWAFRQRLDAHGVQGGYTEDAAEGQQRTYYSRAGLEVVCLVLVWRSVSKARDHKYITHCARDQMNPPVALKSPSRLYRIMKDVDVSAEEQAKRVLQ